MIISFKKAVAILFVLFFISFKIYSQTYYSISGSIRDKGTGETLIGAVVSVKEKPTNGISTNTYGFYSLSLPEGNYHLLVRMLGYTTIDTLIHLKSNLKMNLEISTASKDLNEVVVSAQKGNEHVTSTRMSVEKIDVKEIQAVPVLFGEKDIMKTIQLLPGIKTISEGSTGIYVRGGGVDQNLILLDEANVYNPSHLLGFFSVFNSDAIKDVTIIKGGIPAEYGGRISSVLDIKMNEGNNKSYHVTGGVGIIASRLTIEGPIKKNKGSFIISGRRTYGDLFLKLSRDSNINRTSLYFYDLNMKANYEITSKDRLFLSGYFGKDVLERTASSRSFGTNWGNGTGTLRWNHIFNDKLFLNSSAVFTNYNFNILLGAGDAQFKVTSGIQDFSLKEDFQYFKGINHTLHFGVSAIQHTFIPGEITIGTSSSTGPSRLGRTIERKHAIEGGAYISDEYSFSDRIKIDFGVRYSAFAQIGPGTNFNYDENGNVIDSTIFSNNKIIQKYGGFEPRLATSYVLTPSSSIKASYNHINQYIHLLSNTTSETPVDIWVPSGSVVKPQIGDQVALGYFKNLHENTYESSVEIYYKTLKNQIDYKPGADLRFNKTVDSQLLFGSGVAYGSEFFIRKKAGKLTGWIGYTLSRTLRSFNDIDNGNTFPARQDIIHDLSVVSIYQISKKVTVSATFVYHSGIAVTWPSGKYIVNNEVVSLYTERNGYRMPPYHRMDIGLTWVNKKTEKFESNWNFSVYNVYGRENAYSITFQPDPNNPSRTQAVQLSLFRFVPSVSYNFKF